MRKPWRFFWFRSKVDAMKFALTEGKDPPFKTKHPKTGKSGWGVNL